MTIHKYKYLLQAVVLLTLSVVMALNIAKLPLTGDPDPEGFVSYARYIQDHHSLMEHRRPPLYPLILAITDSLGAGSMHQDAFMLHAATLFFFFLASTLAVWKFFGFTAAVIYASIFADGGSYFTKIGGLMLSDLYLSIAYWAALIFAWRWVRIKTNACWVWLASFVIVVMVGQSLHTSFDKRMIVVVLAASLTWMFHDIFQRREAIILTRSTISKMFIAFVLVIASGTTINQLTTVNTTEPEFVDLDHWIDSPSRYYGTWWTIVQIICLPPGVNPAKLDLDLEQVKNKVSSQLGYRVELHRPSSINTNTIYGAFDTFFRQNHVPMNIWKARVVSNPAEFLLCPLREIKTQYHRILRDITPWRSIEEKTFNVQGWPIPTNSLRDRLFWDYGLNFIHTHNVDAQPNDLFKAIFFELLRAIFVIVSMFLGVSVINRRLGYNLGVVLLFSGFGWLVAATLINAAETRYLMPILPFVYLTQALGFIEIVRRLALAITGRWLEYFKEGLK